MSQDQLVHIDDLTFVKYIDVQAIDAKISEIADGIREDYHDKFPMFLVVMNGAFIYAADLIRKLNFPCELNFIRIKSYRGTESTGKVDIFMPPNIDFKDRYVIIVEDIIDTGNTMTAFMPELKRYEPAEIAITSILVKPEAHQHKIDIKYPGFNIPDKFVVGYGLDYNSKGRNLKDIYQLK